MTIYPPLNSVKIMQKHEIFHSSSFFFSFLLSSTKKKKYMKEQNSFIQYISLSANHIFKRKSHQKNIQEPIQIQAQPYNVINRSLSDMTVSTLESCSISDDEDDDDFTPTPSTSSCTIQSFCKEEPWRLNPLHFDGNEYFFQDRDEKHQNDNNCSISVER